MEKIYIKKKTGSSYRYARAINEKKEFDLNKNEFKTSFIGIKDDDNSNRTNFLPSILSVGLFAWLEKTKQKAVYYYA
jgi:hypothetical protein